MTAADIESAAVLLAEGRRRPPPPDLLTAMLAFEARYGGIRYPLIVGPAMAYGLDADATAYPTPYGAAFAGILDGDWTCGVDVLADGRTTLGPGAWSRRLIDRSVDQRLEKHALLASVRRWPHRAYECFTPTGTAPSVREDLRPPPVPEATGPADRWWSGAEVAVQVALRGWPPGHDHWIVRFFARDLGRLADPVLRPAVHDGHARRAGWCELCARGLPGPAICTP